MCAHGLSYVNILAPSYYHLQNTLVRKICFLVTTLKSERLCAFFSIRTTSKWVDTPICFTSTHHYKARCDVVCGEHVYYVLHSTYMRFVLFG